MIVEKVHLRAGWRQALLHLARDTYFPSRLFLPSLVIVLLLRASSIFKYTSSERALTRLGSDPALPVSRGITGKKCSGANLLPVLLEQPG